VLKDIFASTYGTSVLRPDHREHFLNANFRRLASLHLSDFRVREGWATIWTLTVPIAICEIVLQALGDGDKQHLRSHLNALVWDAMTMTQPQLDS
jgi:hypothetical protein